MVKRIGFKLFLAALMSLSFLACKKDDNSSSSGSGGGGGGGGGGLTATPSAISVQVGLNNSSVITGGTAPYTVKTQPNSATAVAILSGSTLTVTGVADGTTSCVVEDSGGVNTVTVSISVSSGSGGGSEWKNGSVQVDVDGTTYTVTGSTGVLTCYDTSGNFSLTAIHATDGAITISGLTVGGTGTFNLPAGSVTIMDSSFDTFNNPTAVAGGLVITTHSSGSIQGTFTGITLENVLDPTDQLVLTNGVIDMTP